MEGQPVTGRKGRLGAAYGLEGPSDMGRTHGKKTAHKGQIKGEISMTKEERMKEERLTELLKEAEGHPMMKAILAEKAAETLAKRQEAAGKIEVLKKERDEVVLKLQADLDGKEAKFKKAKAALDAAVGEWNAARAALSSETNQRDNEVRQQETVLIETADPAIDEAITFFRDKFDYFWSPGRISSDYVKGERNLISMTETIVVESNVQAIHDAMKYCQAAIKELEKMKLSPALDPGWIEEMKVVIPRIDIFIETTGTKPIPGSKGINPKDLLKSDSQLDWEMGKLNEKFKKLMKK